MNLGDEHIAQQAHEVTKQPREILAGLGLPLNHGQGCWSVVIDKRLSQLKDRLPGGESKNAVNIGGGDRVPAESNDLIEHRLGIAHRAVGSFGKGFGSSGLQGDPLVFCDIEKMARNLFSGESAQIEALATAQDRGRHLLCLGRGKEELHMVGRFLKRLEQGVEGRRREHMNLIDQVDFVGTARRSVGGILTQGTDALDTVIARPIDLHDIETASLGDLDTGIADAARIVRGAVLVGLAVQRLGEDACRRGLPDAARPDKKISLGEAISRDRVLKRPGDVLLADDLLEFLRSVFSCKDAVAHRKRNLGDRPWNVADKLGNAFDRNLNLIHARRITATHMPLAAGTKGRSWDDGDFLRPE